jgi:hypothetical protein
VNGRGPPWNAGGRAHYGGEPTSRASWLPRVARVSDGERLAGDDAQRRDGARRQGGDARRLRVSAVLAWSCPPREVWRKGVHRAQVWAAFSPLMSGPITEVQGFAQARSERLVGRHRIGQVRSCSRHRSSDETHGNREKANDGDSAFQAGAISQRFLRARILRLRPTAFVVSALRGISNGLVFGNEPYPRDGGRRAMASRASPEVPANIHDFDRHPPAVDQIDFTWQRDRVTPEGQAFSTGPRPASVAGGGQAGIPKACRSNASAVANRFPYIPAVREESRSHRARSSATPRRRSIAGDPRRSA